MGGSAKFNAPRKAPRRALRLRGSPGYASDGRRTHGNGGAEHMVPYRCGHAEVSAFRRIMMAHVPGAEIVEIGGRFVRAVMDDMMHDPIPPVAEHHADGQAVSDIETQAQPRRNQ